MRRQYEARVTAGSVDTRIQLILHLCGEPTRFLVLARGHVDISNLTVTSGNSELHFAGRMDDFHRPRLSGEYHGTADLGQIAFLARQLQLRKGTAQFEGKGSWNIDDFSTQGTLQARDIDWSNGKLLLRNGRVAAVFFVTPQRAHFASIKGNLFGGEVTGEADITNWQTSFQSPFQTSPQTSQKTSSQTSPAPARRRSLARTPPGALQRGELRLLLAGFPLLPAMEVLSSKKFPLDHLDLSGSATGSVEVLWNASIRNAETRLNVSVAASSRPGSNGTPVHGQINAIYRAGSNELEVSQLHLTTAASDISAAGALAANSSLHFTFTSHNVKEWWPLLQAAYGSADLPFAVHGWASLSGTATGQVTAPSINGSLAVYDFDSKLPAHGQVASRFVHWDALSAAVQLSNTHFAAHNGLLIHGHTMARFNANATLDEALASNNSFALDFTLHNADLAEIDQVIGIDRPLAGTLNASGTISGTPNNPTGSGHLDLHNALAYNVAVPLLKSDFRLADNEVQFDNIEANPYDAALSGSAAISLFNIVPSNNSAKNDWTKNDWAKNQFKLNLSLRNLNLSNFPRLHTGRFKADGVADFTLRASGTAEQPALEAHLHLKDLALDQQRAGDFYLDAVTHGRQLDLNAHSEFENAGLSITGNVGLERDMPADLTLNFHHLNADSLLRIYFPAQMTEHSRVEGTVHLRGPLRTPAALKASAEITTFAADVEHIHLQNVDPLRFEFADQTVLLENFHLAGSGTDFVAHGRAHLAGAKNIDLDLGLEGSVNMALLQSFNPKILARGQLAVNLTAAGTIAQPVLQGRIELKNTFLSHNDFPSGLSDLNGVLTFDRNRIQIEHLSGTTGGGTIALNGSASYQNGAVLLDLGATAQDVRLRYPPGVSSTANANLRLTGTANSAVLSGDVVVTKLAITPGFDFSAYIERSTHSIALTQGDSLASRLKLDVHVSTTPELQMQTAIARLSGNADLRLRGTAQRPAILGRVEVLEGEVTFNGTKYNLDRGDVTFANPAKTQPVIDLQATTRVRDYDITVQLRGDASVPNGVKVTWQSEPQLPEADVIALLALGRTQAESAAAAQSGSFGFGGDASNLLINEALNSTVNSRLQRLFGASRVKIDPQGLASETNVIRGPQVTIEQEVASKLTLTYSTNVSVSNQQIIQAEYHLTRTVSIVALRDQNGVVSFDFKLRTRKK